MLFCVLTETLNLWLHVFLRGNGFVSVFTFLQNKWKTLLEIDFYPSSHHRVVVDIHGCLFGTYRTNYTWRSYNVYLLLINCLLLSSSHLMLIIIVIKLGLLIATPYKKASLVLLQWAPDLHPLILSISVLSCPLRLNPPLVCANYIKVKLIIMILYMVLFVSIYQLW